EGDYTLEVRDSLANDELEFTVGAASDGGSRVRRSQRVSFKGGGTRGTLRDGDDALSGGRVAAPFAAGTLTAGRLAPRWGRGLVLGGASEPWARSALDRGERAAYRGRAGEGLAYDDARGALLVGRFDRAPLVATRVNAGAFALGSVVARDQAQWSVAYEHAEHAIETAFARAGRWRAEGTLTGAAGANIVRLRLRGGTRSYRPLAEPRRAGPPHAAVLSVARQGGAFSSQALGALWRWAGGRTGARGALEVAARLRQHESFAVGLEEQHGARREPTPSTRPTGTRQGVWVEWRGGPPEARFALRHELWGARAFARDAVRRAVVARVERGLPAGGRVAVTHAVWLVKRGESLYLPEPEADRLVLRALAGVGTRTRAELTLPFATGDIRLGLAWVTSGTRAGTRPPAWTVEWARRSRLARSRAAAASGSVHEVRATHEPPDDGRFVRHAGPWQGAGGPGT
ncbi:MAG: hypothetical protein K8R56_02335, partial [Candidatus Eisenbacteria bacterium]|nr:hypothetical protein [Candidatus Eisenbacteria bacterium]